jgi:TIR domain
VPQKYVFISYVRESRRTAQRLVDDLTARGVDVWIDYQRLLPGERWQNTIRDAIRSGSFFLALFTPEYTSRASTYMNDELAFAIDELRLRPTDRAWFIPVVISGTGVPDRSIGGGDTLRDLHWIDLSDGWEVAVDVITKMVITETGSLSCLTWSGLSREIARYSPTPLHESLERGAIPVQDYRFEETLFTIARSCQRSVQTVSYDDIDIWSSAEPRSRRYQAEKNSALMRGFAMSRIVVIPRERLRHAAAQVRELLLDHFFRRIGLAIVISEHVPEDRRHSGHDFAIFDGGATVSIGGRQSPWILFAFDTRNVVPATDRMAERQVWLYTWLTEHAVLSTDEFLRQHPALFVRVSEGNSFIAVTADDDLDERIEAVNSMNS